MAFSLLESKIVAKGVDYMDEENILDKLLEEQNGYIRLIDAQNEGLSKYTVMEYVRKFETER